MSDHACRHIHCNPCPELLEELGDANNAANVADAHLGQALARLDAVIALCDRAVFTRQHMLPEAVVRAAATGGNK